MKKIISSVLFVVLCLLIVFGLSGLILWGIGVAVCKVFEINYNWTFWHGLITGIVLTIIGNTFTTTTKVIK